MATSPETAAPAKASMPLRQASTMSTQSDEAVPTSDPRNTSELLAERLQAWKHAVGYLEDFVEATEKVEKLHAKEYERVLKTIADPLKEGHHFDQSLGGIAGLFENIRANTQSLANSHAETEKNIKGSVRPILERLHKEIKHKSKELASGAAKGAKEVEKARNTTQKHIELLGQHTASFESTGGKNAASDDPYVINRGVLHRLHKQILEENNHRQDLISVQDNFASFEQHVVEVIQQAIASFNQFVGGQAQRDQTIYADILSTAQRIPPDFEWNGFVSRSGHILIDPKGSPRTMESTNFPNQHHSAVQALVEGTLERKSRNMLSSGYSTGYYVVTPSKFLHGFKDNDDVRKDPQPDISIYLPDATIGATSGAKFNVKGKDVSKSLTAKFSGQSELAFKAHTPADAEKWFQVIRQVAGSSPVAYESAPATPIDAKTGAAASTLPLVAPKEKSAAGATAPPTYAADEKSAAVPAAALATPARVQTQDLPSGKSPASPAPLSATTPVSAAAATPVTPVEKPAVSEKK